MVLSALLLFGVLTPAVHYSPKASRYDITATQKSGSITLPLTESRWVTLFVKDTGARPLVAALDPKTGKPLNGVSIYRSDGEQDFELKCFVDPAYFSGDSITIRLSRGQPSRPVGTVTAWVGDPELSRSSMRTAVTGRFIPKHYLVFDRKKNQSCRIPFNVFEAAGGACVRGVRVLVRGKYQYISTWNHFVPGDHSLEWDGCGSDGKPLQGGKEGKHYKVQLWLCWDEALKCPTLGDDPNKIEQGYSSNQVTILIKN